MVKDGSDPDGQYLAAQCLGDLGPDAEDSVPVLIEYVNVTTFAEDDRPNIAIAFGRIGPAAIDAVPILEEWANEAQKELDRIVAIEQITKPGPFESQVFRARRNLELIVEAMELIEGSA